MPDRDVRVKVQGPRFRSVLVIVGGLLVAFMTVGAVIAYNKYHDSQERDRAVRESQVQDYALCVVQNENRLGVRRVSLVTFNLVTAVLLAGGPADPETRRVFRRQLGELSKQLQALKPIDCSTYVRPVPPDTGDGVESPTGSG